MKKFCMIACGFILLCILAYTAVAQAEDFTFPYPVHSVLPTLDGFIAESDGKLYHITAEKGATEVLNLLKLYGSGTIYAGSDGTVWSEYIQKDESLDESALQWCFSRLEEHDGVWTIAEKIFCNERPVSPSNRMLYQHNAILVDENSISYCAFNNYADASFVRISRTQPEKIQITSANVLNEKNLQYLFNYHDGKFLSLSSKDVVSYDPCTQQISVLAQLPVYPDGIGYCAETDTFVYLLDSLVYVMPLSTGVATVQGYLPISSTYMCVIVLNAQGQCAVADGNVLRMTTLSPDFSMENNTLHIASYYRDREETRQFRLSHPEFPILTKNFSYQLFPADVAEMIRTGDNTYDMFNIRTFERGYSALMEKGFAMDLSSSETLRVWADSLLPAVRDAVTVDGKLMGIPVDIDIAPGCPVYAVNEELLNSYGLTFDQLPDDLLSLLAQLTEWYQDGTLYEVIPFGYLHQDNNNVPSSIQNHTLFPYISYAFTQNEWIDLNDPMFTRLMKQAEALIQTMDENNCLQPYPALFTSLGLSDIVEEQYQYRLEPLPKLLLLKCFPEADFTYSVDLTIAIVNPLSCHKEQALYYMEKVVKNMDIWSSLYLCPQTAEPVVDPLYEADLTEFEEELAELEQLKAETSPEEWLEWDMEPDMEQLRDNIADCQTRLYKMNEEQIARYRSLCSNTVIRGDNQCSLESQKQVTAAIRQYYQNTITLEEMIARIQQVITMMQMDE